MNLLTNGFVNNCGRLFGRLNNSVRRMRVVSAPRIPLVLLVLGAIDTQATPALLIPGALAGALQMLDAGIGLSRRDLRKCAGRFFSPSSNSSWCICITVRADHPVNQARINAHYGLAL